MKLIMENWKKFIKEQKLHEMTDEEEEYIRPLLEIPIEDYPFGNIFGNSYRIIQPFNSADETTDFGIMIKALGKMGWEMSSPKDGKILVSKTKISHYIDGRGKQGLSRKEVSYNLPKVLAGIVGFIDNSRWKLVDKAKKQVESAMERQASGEAQSEDAKYPSPTGAKLMMTANEYRATYQFLDNQIFWLGDVGNQVFVTEPEGIFKAKGIDYSRFKSYASYVNDSMYDLIKNIDKYLVSNYIIYSRHPIDVFRMSDHEHIIEDNPENCHRLPSEKGEQRFDRWNKCALSEAYGNGMIAYVVPAEDFKMFPPTQESLDALADEEIFYDKRRPEADGELVPVSRIRIKHVAFQKDENSEAVRVAVPQGNVYGPKYPGFIDVVQSKMASVQKNEIQNVISQANDDAGAATLSMSEFTRYGGSYQDSGYSVAKTIPALFRKVSKDIKFYGTRTRYDEDVENAVLASIGQNNKTVFEQRLAEIFRNHTGGFITYDWSVEEDMYGQPYYDWWLNVEFKMKIPSSANSSEVQAAVVDAADHHFEDYYNLPATDNVFVTREEKDQWSIKLVYYGDTLSPEAYHIGNLDGALDEVVARMNVFDYYYDDGAIQYIEYMMEEYNILPTERNNVANIIRKYDLRNDSWWPLEEEENAEHELFGGEYLNFAAFQDTASVFIDSIMEKVPENMKQATYKHIADFLNLLTGNDELAGKIALNQDTWNNKTDPNIIIMLQDYTHDITPEDIEGTDEFEIRIGVSIFNDFSQEILEKTGDYLKNSDNADPDQIVARIEAAIEKYVAEKLKSSQNISENKKRVKIRVKR